MSDLPIDIVRKAYVSPGAKEFVWRRGDLEEAFRVIVASGQAILGGEVWMVKDVTQNWVGLIPSNNGSPPSVWSWDTAPRIRDESWNSYCKRTQVESLQAVASLNVENEAAPEAAPFLWFNVTFVEEDEA